MSALSPFQTQTPTTQTSVELRLLGIELHFMLDLCGIPCSATVHSSLCTLQSASCNGNIIAAGMQVTLWSAQRRDMQQGLHQRFTSTLRMLVLYASTPASTSALVLPD